MLKSSDGSKYLFKLFYIQLLRKKGDNVTPFLWGTFKINQSASSFSLVENYFASSSTVRRER